MRQETYLDELRQQPADIDRQFETAERRRELGERIDRAGGSGAADRSSLHAELQSDPDILRDGLERWMRHH